MDGGECEGESVWFGDDEWNGEKGGVYHNVCTVSAVPSRR